MQLRLPWDPGPSGPVRPRALVVGGRAFPVEIVRHRRARRYLLRMTAAGTLRLTVPRGASIAGGLRFAEQQTDWIAREWCRQEAHATPWGTGTRCWFRGEALPIVIDEHAIRCGPEVVPAPGGARDVRAALEAHLRALAARELPVRCSTLAAASGFTIARVSVRNQRSRWGACSARGAITLNWRLIQMPPAVSDYVIFHELAHMKQPNHSRRFWREVEKICPEWRAAERWLRVFGKEIL